MRPVPAADDGSGEQGDPRITLMWDRFVDVVTLVWLGVFAAEFVAPFDETGMILLSLLPVYVVDLGVQYRRVGNLSRFLKADWLTILMVIPYFRVLRLVRLFRLLRAMRAVRAMRIARTGKKWHSAVRKLRRLSGRLAGTG